MEEVTALSNEELRTRLENLGVSLGPITATTRSLFEKKLLRLLGSFKDETTTTETGSSDCSLPNGGSKCDAGGAAVSPVIETLTGTETGNACEEPKVFFAISVPDEILLQHHPEARVFTDKKAALDAVKKTPGARFKVFTAREEALHYASIPANKILTPMAAKDSGGPAQVPVGENSAFRGPKIQDLMAMRKALERGEVEVLRQRAWENPRYLVSGGDTPSILQEGFRYNALHVAAMKNQPEIAVELLEILANPDFMALLYPTDSEHTRSLRMIHLIDLYLNMPDKGNQETALHFACKFGHVEMVRILLAQPGTKQQLKNRHGETPMAIVCQRARENCAESKSKIKQLFEAQCYVPLLRTDDNSVPPIVGKPWSPTQDDGNSEPDHTDPYRPDFTIKAFAGPMSPVEAEKFRHLWVTPPSPQGSPQSKAYQAIRRGDIVKGMERIGRDLAQDMTVPWSEYWDFLDTYLDLSSEEGLATLEEYLTEQQRTVVPSADFSISDITLQGHQDISITDIKLQSLSDTSVLDKTVEEVGPVSVNPSPLSPVSQLGLDFERLCLRSPGISSPDGNKNNCYDTNSRTESNGTQCLATHSQCDSITSSLGNISIVTPVHELATKTTCLVPPVHNLEKCGSGTTHSQQLSESCMVELAASGDKNGLDLLQLPSRVRTLSEGSDSSTDSFYTATQSLPRRSPSPEVREDESDDDPCTPVASRTVIDIFLLGEEPTKLDTDVLNALENVDVSPVDYPNLARWRHHILSFSEQTRHKWRTPSRRRLSLSTPRRSGLSPGVHSKHHSPVSPLLLRSTPGRRLVYNLPQSPQSGPMTRNLMSSFMSAAPDQN